MTAWFPNGTPGARLEQGPDLALLGPAAFLTALIATPGDIARHEVEWRRLAARTCEPNPYFGPDIALAALRHLRRGAQPQFVLVRDTRRPAGDRLVGLLPVLSKERRNALSLETWRHPFMTSGTPLLDRDSPNDVATALLGILSGSGPGGTVLAFRDLPLEGRVACAFRYAATSLGFHWRVHNDRDRASLTENSAPTDTRERRSLRRKRRRLAEQGEVAVAVAGDYSGRRRDFEDFLHIEASGWKGRAGTALLQDPGEAAFARTFLWAQASTGEAHIATLRLDGHTIASLIVLIDGNAAYLWKIAYDEAYARFSPGVLLVEETSRVLMQQGITQIDSCAETGNAMVERLWRGRMRVGDLMVALAPDATDALDRFTLSENRHEIWRAQAKAAYRFLRNLRTPA